MKIAKPAEPVNGKMNDAFHAPPLTVPPAFADRQSRRESLKMASPHFNFERKIRLLFRECGYPFGTLCPIVRRGTRDGASYTPCLPAASNALAFPDGNGIFTATPTERITHYTLLRKVVCQMGALPPLETPTRKGGTLPLHGAHTAFSCYPALRLYRLSKSQRGNGVVSLSK